jgi:hypothetical protein
MVMNVNRPERPEIDAMSDNMSDEDEFDGWGPVRPRRSSAPVPLLDCKEDERETERVRARAPSK